MKVYCGALRLFVGYACILIFGFDNTLGRIFLCTAMSRYTIIEGATTHKRGDALASLEPKLANAKVILSRPPMP
jgi:hypothetical protein